MRVRNDHYERYLMQKELQRKDISINRRIGIIQNIADKISGGNYEIRITEEGKDTLGSLSDSLNKMAESLQYSFGQLSAKEWLQKGVVDLNEKMMGETDMKKLTAAIIEFVCIYTQSQVGALYVQENAETLRLYSSYAFQDDGSRTIIDTGSGLIGQCSKSGKPAILKDIDEGFISVSYASAEVKPRNVIIFPVFHDKTVNGVIELASIYEYSPNHLAFIENVSDNIGIVINSARNRQKLQELLEETQAQSEELHAQHSELQSLNAELEGQTEKLQSSDEELRVQQEELLMTNQELEERTRLLEDKNQLILERNIEIQTKAEQLALSTKYKSEFLANMSHELRTPLNSILLLSGLMANNEKKNLSEEHIEYAKVIQSSGNGLLALIDEILDLSKIEAGKMDLHYEPVYISEMTDTLRGMFNPVAKDKNITLNIHVAQGMPETIQTDKMRLEQVIRNLLANALKFTPSGGEVTVNFYQPSTNTGHIAISVKDTGIGIAKEKQQVIFEAFQQEDGSTRRKYGGTGLGLSISRDLIRLLKGDIGLISEAGEGSEFIITIPVERPMADHADLTGTDQFAPLMKPLPAPITHGQEISAIPETAEETEPDDRKNISSVDKVVLIIEDDQAFAKILLDFTRSNGYKGIIAHRGDEGIEYARKYRPTGIMLDIELPVKNGWEVMELLKNDPLTKNIPVHVMSSYPPEKGKLGKNSSEFLNKPVEFEKIREIFQKFNQSTLRSSRKVLIIEENSIHSKALAYFLENYELKTVIKTNVEDCISALLQKGVECVILEMGNLDQENFSRIGEVKKVPGLEQIPVIVFTTKNLTKAEEFRLKEFADSIVVKTAHSYQRILDEVTLFLHVVEEKSQNEKKAGPNKKTGALKEVLENRTVLITDDDVRNIFSLTKALEAFNMNVLSAMDGKEALQQLKENPKVDIILMDMMMPEMDGYETIMHIRKNPSFKYTPVISITAKAMAGDREKCIVAGASDYISKPVDIDQLLSLLRVWLYDKQFNKN
jgi:signal transduction histidine kinase/CheY-like chemotaxis protein